MSENTNGWKQCPFCGNEDLNAVHDIFGIGPLDCKYSWVKCPKCFATGPKLKVTDDDAKGSCREIDRKLKASWNTRIKGDENAK